MEDAASRAVRLIEALEMIAQQTGTILRRFSPVQAGRILELIETSGPLVRDLQSLQETGAIGNLQPRVAALQEELLRNEQMIGDQLGAMRTVLARCNEARSRLTKVAPAYGLGADAGSRSRFRAAG